MRMQRRINQTGRKRIKRECVEIHLNETSGESVPSFSAKVSLDGLELPDSADVFVEAYHKTSAQRFSFGNVGQIVPPESTRLDNVDLDGRLLFRLKVVDNEGTFGRLLASSDHIPPLDGGEQPGRDYLVSVKSADLGELPWEVALDNDPMVRPVLLVNSLIPDAINQIRHNPTLQAFVLPALMREIFAYIFWDCSNVIPQERNGQRGWQELWLGWGRELAGSEPPRSDESYEARQWIDEVVREFSRLFELNSRLVMAVTGESV